LKAIAEIWRYNDSYLAERLNAKFTAIFPICREEDTCLHASGYTGRSKI